MTLNRKKINIYTIIFKHCEVYKRESIRFIYIRKIDIFLVSFNTLVVRRVV